MSENGSNFHCPHCRGKRLQVAASTNFSASTNVTRKKVTTTVQSSNIRYWCCQDCGGTFPFPQDVEQQAIKAQKDAEIGKVSGIVIAICGVFLLLIGGISSIFAAFGGFSLLIGLLCIALVPGAKKKAEALYDDYAHLLAKCTD